MTQKKYDPGNICSGSGKRTDSEQKEKLYIQQEETKMNRIEKALENHKKGYNCSQSVACAFCDKIGMD